MHNVLRMVCNKYPKTLTAAYDLAINWKGGTKGTGVTPNDGVAITTKSVEAYIQAIDGMKLKQTGKPVIFHICGKNHYATRCPDRE